MTGYRTIVIAAIVAVVGALQGLDWLSLLPNDPKLAGWAVTGIGVLMGALRAVTTTAVGVKP